MSFFNSLHQIVTSSVANLSLSPKRFSLSREGSSTDSTGSGPTSGGNGAATGLTPPAAPHGFPKVVPAPGTVSPLQRTLSARRRTLADSHHHQASLALPPGTGPPIRRAGSFRKQCSQQPGQRQVFCRRRQSWPEVDNQATSGVQETDSSFFESFTALAWKQENRRLIALQEMEERTSTLGEDIPSEYGLINLPHLPEIRLHKKELEQLYVEVLYTIKNKVGASTGPYSHYKEELYSYAQQAFGIHPEHHRTFLSIASEEKPPIVVLNVVVLEAEGLEAKDANGFSDPYCMLGIQPASAGSGTSLTGVGVSCGSPAPSTPQPPSTPRETPPASPRNLANRTMSDSGVEAGAGTGEGSHEKLRKHHSFRLSFKRKEPTTYVRDRREQRDSLSVAVPAKFIRATSVKPQTLNPRWNEKFRFDIDDVASDILHLDIWDHDDESSVFDAVSKLNEVRGVKGLGRFFKQIAQSARSGSQDDFLGCVNIPLQDIPSTGLDCWYKLEARTQRSNIQGRIRLKLWLSTREDRGNSEEDNWSEIRQQERLHAIFISHELAKAQCPSWNWSGELPQVALTILHQHAIQGDVTELQLAMVRWIAFSRKSLETPLEFKLLHRLLIELDNQWPTENLSKEEEECLAESFNLFIDYGLQLIRKHRQFFLPNNRTTMNRLEYLLRCFSLLSTMKAFWKCCPFNKEIRGEIITALKKGTLEWYEEMRGQHASVAPVASPSRLLPQPPAFVVTTTSQQPQPPPSPAVTLKTEAQVQSLLQIITLLLVDLQKGHDCYNSLFETINAVPYFCVVYKHLEKMVHSDIGSQVTAICLQIQAAEFVEDLNITNAIEIATPIFELYLAIQEIATLFLFDPLRYEEALDRDNPHRMSFIVPLFNLPIDGVFIFSFRQFIPIQDHKSLSINQYYEWFEPAIDKWLDVAKIKAFHRIRKAMELNRVCQGDLIVKHSTSALDVTACFYQIREFWKQLSWPDQLVSYNFIMKIIDGICTASIYYADLTHQQLQETGYYEDSTPFKMNDEMCVTVNDLEYVRRSLSVLGAELHVEAVLEVVEAAASEANRLQWRQALYALLEDATMQLETRVLQVINRVSAKMRPALKKAMFHLAWSPESLPTADAISPLLDYLDGHLVPLNAALLPRNFERVLIDVWEVALLELGQQMDGNAGDKVPLFYDRLYEALEILVEFFHAEQKGLPMDCLRSATFWDVEQKLQYHKTDTERLIACYYQQRLQEQLMTESTEYGVLSVRAYFNHDSLCVEVLNARDVIPLDPNGFSDPFVIIELLPRKVFSHCMEQQTNVQKKTLNPFFDECFEFSVTLEQCRTDGAMILFTVMDHDVLTFNDFAGEAFLALGNIPGVDESNTGIDNFHGLKQVDLNLMQQKNKNHAILQILDTRIGDKIAQEFVKKQKQRFSTP